MCPRCGRLIASTINTTRELALLGTDDLVSRLGTSTFTERTSVVIQVRDSEQQFIFPAENAYEIVLGRKDPTTGATPWVDLSAFGADEMGVSRRHASIVRRDAGTVHIIDHASQNGSFLNGMRLVAEQPRILRDGDELRLGRLILLVNFKQNLE